LTNSPSAPSAPNTPTIAPATPPSDSYTLSLHDALPIYRLSKLLLLRHGILDSGGNAWTAAHHSWLVREAQTQLAHSSTRMAFDSDYEAVLAMEARRGRLDEAITVMATSPQYAPLIHRLGCLRGVSTLTGFGLAVEIGDWHRFTGNSIGAYVGLVPSEHSSG